MSLAAGEKKVKESCVLPPAQKNQVQDRWLILMGRRNLVTMQKGGCSCHRNVVSTGDLIRSRFSACIPEVFSGQTLKVMFRSAVQLFKLVQLHV